jgi:hypothetical protein
VLSIALTAPREAHASFTAGVYVEVNGLLGIMVAFGLEVAEFSKGCVAKAYVLHPLTKRSHDDFLDVASRGAGNLRARVHDEVF